MNTPNPKFFCPRCRAAFDVDSSFCGRCGADMHRASRLLHALSSDEDSYPRSHRTTEPASAAQLDLLGSDTTEAGQLLTASRDRRSTTAFDPWLGKLVDGRYRVIDIVGRGGMGIVYKVEHQRMGKIAAMKVLHRDLANDKEVLARFQREAKTVSKLTHPNTVQVFDFGTAHGAMYLVMEYVRGLDMGSLIDRDGPMPFDRAAPLFAQTCAALGEAHQLGVVHRDLKPENVLVTRTHDGGDFVKVLDFGLAKLAELDDQANTTAHDSIVGTPYYMSPEQIRGDHNLDGRSDIYSLGAMMYRVLTGEPAFTAANPVGVLTKHLTEDIVLPSVAAPGLAIPRDVDEIVSKAMAKDPANRYGNVGELLEDLEAAYSDLVDTNSSGRRALSWKPGSDRHTPRSIPFEPEEAAEADRNLRRADIDAFERSLKQRKRAIAAIVPILIVGVLAGSYYYLHWRSQQPQTSESEDNNRIEDATLIASGKPVSGLLGKRMSGTESDRDFYQLSEVPNPSGGDHLTVELSPLPNMDLVLELYGPGGTLIAQRDEGGIGAPEVLRLYRVRQAIYLKVGEHRAGESLPTENVSDRYTLSAKLTAGHRGNESEPNDTASDANDITSGEPIQGWLDRRMDVDIYQYDGEAGRFRISLSGSEEIPMIWKVAGKAVEQKTAVLQLASGDMIEVSRLDTRWPRDQVLPGVDEPYSLAITAER